MCQVLHIVDFWGSRRLETAPTSIEVLLRPTQSQSDEPSDLRGFLSPTIVYTAPGSHPSTYEPGATSLNFSDRADIDERTPYSVYCHCYIATPYIVIATCHSKPNTLSLKSYYLRRIIGIDPTQPIYIYQELGIIFFFCSRHVYYTHIYSI